jgi:hypothetical protein
MSKEFTGKFYFLKKTSMILLYGLDKHNNLLTLHETSAKEREIFEILNGIASVTAIIKEVMTQICNW